MLKSKTNQENDFNKFYDLKADVFSKNNKIIIYAEVPGMDLKDLSIDVINGYIVIKGMKKKYYFNKNNGIVNEECPQGVFKKYIAIPESSSSYNHSVMLNKGILNISLCLKN